MPCSMYFETKMFSQLNQVFLFSTWFLKFKWGVICFSDPPPKPPSPYAICWCPLKLVQKAWNSSFFEKIMNRLYRCFLFNPTSIAAMFCVYFHLSRGSIVCFRQPKICKGFPLHNQSAAVLREIPCTKFIRLFPWLLGVNSSWLRGTDGGSKIRIFVCSKYGICRSTYGTRILGSKYGTRSVYTERLASLGYIYSSILGGR